MLQCDWLPTPFINAKDGRRWVVCSRKGCPKFAFAPPNGKPVKSHCRHAHLSLGDVAATAIRVVTFGLLKPCKPCKSRQSRWNRFTTTIPGDLWTWLRGGITKTIWENSDDPRWVKLRQILAYSPLDQIVAVDSSDPPTNDPANDDQNSRPVVKLIDPPHL